MNDLTFFPKRLRNVFFLSPLLSLLDVVESWRLYVDGDREWLSSSAIDVSTVDPFFGTLGGNDGSGDNNGVTTIALSMVIVSLPHGCSPADGGLSDDAEPMLIIDSLNDSTIPILAGGSLLVRCSKLFDRSSHPVCGVVTNGGSDTCPLPLSSIKSSILLERRCDLFVLLLVATHVRSTTPSMVSSSDP